MVDKLIFPEEALTRILNLASTTGFEVIDIYHAVGRIAAEDVKSRRDLPSYHNSAMDGYAVMYDDINEVPCNLEVIGVIQAGDDVSNLKIERGQAYRIMTGAFIPKNADTVVELEVTSQTENSVAILKEKKKWANIRFAGEDIKKGDLINIKGEKITPEIYARLISTGINFIKVYRKPKVLVIGTGNELTFPGDNVDKFKTIDANSFYVTAALQNIGADTCYMGISKDSVEDFANIILENKTFDFIVTSAGISEGDFDVVSNSKQKLNIEWIFKGVKQKPGKPFSFGLINNKPIFALPGNPVSSAFCAFYYIFPFLRKSLGMQSYLNDFVSAKTTFRMYKRNKRFHFNRGVLKFNRKKNMFEVTPFSVQGSHIIASLSACNAFIVIDSDTVGEIHEGTDVTCYIYDKERIF